MDYRVCRCGCGQDLSEAEYHFQAQGYLNALHKARAEEKGKKKPKKKRWRRSPRR